MESTSASPDPLDYESSTLGRTGEIPIERIVPDNESLCLALSEP